MPLKDHFQCGRDVLASTEPLYFYGEMVFPDAFDDYVNLRPLKGAAEILASDINWGKLYDIEQLKRNEVKVSAATQVLPLPVFSVH